jgi:hypothetical protein
MGMQIRKLIIFLFSSLNQTRESKVKPTPPSILLSPYIQKLLEQLFLKSWRGKKLILRDLIVILELHDLFVVIFS